MAKQKTTITVERHNADEARCLAHPASMSAAINSHVSASHLPECQICALSPPPTTPSHTREMPPSLHKIQLHQLSSQCKGDDPIALKR